MPQVIGAIAGAIGAFAGAATGSAIVAGAVTAIATVAINVGISLAVSALLAPKSRGGPSAARRTGATFAVRQASAARRVLYGKFPALGGVWTYVERTGTDGKDLFLVMYIGDGPIEAIDKVYFDGDHVSLESAGNDANGRTIWKPLGGHDLEDFVRISLYTGAAGQPADASLIAAGAGKWTANHTGDGVAYAVVKLTYNQDAFPQGIPNISFSGRGRNDVYDPRVPGNAYTRNCALCLAHYLTQAQTGLNADYAAEVDEAALIAAANICDEAVNAGGYGMINRYNCDGYVDLSDSPETILDDFKEAMAGWMVYVSGKFVIHAGAYAAPTFTIDEDMIVEAVTLKNRLPRRERINRVKGVYVAEENSYQETDFPAVTNATYEANDGEELAADLNLVFTTHPHAAQRIAKIVLESARHEKSVTLRCNLRALRAVAGATVAVNFARYGFASKVFFVESSTLVPVAGGTAMGVALQLREYGSSIYDWDYLTDPKEVPATQTLVAGPPKVGDLTPTPPGGDFPIEDFPFVVNLSTPTSGAIIRWSKAATPASEAAGTYYDPADASTHPVIRDGETLYARAFKPGEEPSNPITEAYHADFNPRDVADLEGWWRFDVARRLVVRQPGLVNPAYSFISNSIEDSLRPNGNLSTNPTYDAQKAYIKFDGGNDRFELRQVPLATFDGTRPKTIIIATTNPATPARTAVCLGSSFSDEMSLVCSAGAWKARSQDGGVVDESSGIAATASVTEIVAAVFSSATERYVRVAGASDTPNTDSSTPVATSLNIGAHRVNGTFGDFGNHAIHAILVYNRALTNTEIDALATDYLAKLYPLP